MGDTRGGNWGCHPSYFSWKTWRPFFSRQQFVPGFSSSQKLMTFFAHHYQYRFLLLSLGCHPLKVSPHTFLICPTSFPHYSLSICPQNIFCFGCHPLEGVTRGGPPPSDATDTNNKFSAKFLAFLNVKFAAKFYISPVK